MPLCPPPASSRSPSTRSAASSAISARSGRFSWPLSRCRSAQGAWASMRAPRSPRSPRRYGSELLGQSRLKPDPDKRQTSRPIEAVGAGDAGGGRDARAGHARLRVDDRRHAVERTPGADRADPGRGRRVDPVATGVDLVLVRAPAARQTQSAQSGGLVLLCLAAWAIPGAGHLWLGRRFKGLVFLVALPLMFAIGLAHPGPAVPVRAFGAAGRAGGVRRPGDRPAVFHRHGAGAWRRQRAAPSPTSTATRSSSSPAC